MCVANSVRSQMAEGLTKHFLSKDLTVYNAVILYIIKNGVLNFRFYRILTLN